MIKSFLLLFCGILFGATMTARAQTGSIGEINWNIAGGTLYITGTGAIPNYSGTNSPWYANRTDITSIDIGNGVTSIGNYAFNNCTSLKTITIQDGTEPLSLGITNIFYACPIETLYLGRDLTYTSTTSSPFAGRTELKTVTLGRNVTALGVYLFSGCTALESVIIPGSLTSVGTRAFQNCSSLTNQTANDVIAAINSITTYVFSGCSGLTDIVIPATITSVGDYAFTNCSTLKNVTIQDAAETLSFAGINIFSNTCPIETLYLGRNLTYTATTSSPFAGRTTLKTVTLGSNVTAIGVYLFSGCTALESVIIPGSLTSVGTRAFQNCSSLTNQTANDVITAINSIAAYVFSGCSGLTDIVIPATITSVGDYAFSNCSSLKTVTIQDAAETLSFAGVNIFSNTCPIETLYLGRDFTYTSTISSPFSGRTTLKTVMLGRNVTALGVYLFNGCTALEFVIIPGSLTSIGIRAFQNCRSLTNQTANGIMTAINSIPAYLFSGCSGLTDIVIPATITSVGDYAFSNCSTLKTVTIQDGTSPIDFGNDLTVAFLDSPVETLYMGRDFAYNYNRYSSAPFSNSTTLKNVTIGYNVTVIHNFDFYGCSLLTSITIPRSVTSIGESAFYQTGLESVYAQRTEPAELIGSNCFPRKTKTLYAPTASIDVYREKWGEYFEFFVPYDVEEPEQGILGYDVKKVGNYGISAISFDGYGFDDDTWVTFTHPTHGTIQPDTIICLHAGKIAAVTDFTDMPLGIYDINVMYSNNTTIVINQGLEIEAYRPVELDVSIIGSSAFRVNVPVTYYVTIHNKGNTTAYFVPLPLNIISSDIISNIKLNGSFEFDQSLTKELLMHDPETQDSLRTFFAEMPHILHFLPVKDEEKFKLMGLFVIPEIAPGSSETMTITITTGATNVNFEAYIPDTDFVKMILQNNSGNRIALIQKAATTYCDHDWTDCTYHAFHSVIDAALLAKEFYVSKWQGLGCVADLAGRSIYAYATSKWFENKINNDPDFDNKTNKLKKWRSLGSDALKGVLSCFERKGFAKQVRAAFSDIRFFARDLHQTGEACGYAATMAALEWLGKCDPLTPRKVALLPLKGVSSFDPNDKIGYRSPSGSTYFNEEITNMIYVINFENDPDEATAPAQDVYIEDYLDLSKFDVNSFRASFVSFGDHFEMAPYDVQTHTWNIDMRPKTDLIARVTLTLNKETGLARWHFASIDPDTGQPVTDALAGFLPPNDENGIGQGSVSFTIDLKKGLEDGAEIRNMAEIIFDNNDPILTPEWINCKDVTAPVSYVVQPQKPQDNTVQMRWEGTDKGSGIWYYDIYMSDNNGGYTLWQKRTTASEAFFEGEMEHTYRFFSVATDSVGNVEAMKTTAEAVVLFSDAPPVIGVVVSPANVHVQKGKTQQFTAEVTAGTGVSTAVTWSVNSTGGSSINASGLLAVAVQETATTLTVSAVSVVDDTKKGTGTVTVENITGTGELLNSDVELYPNPFNGLLHLTGAKGYILKVSGESGQTVHVQMISSPDETIRLEHLPAGVYFFTIENSHEKKTIKVVKMN